MKALVILSLSLTISNLTYGTPQTNPLDLVKKVACSVKINSKSQKLSYNPKTQTLDASAGNIQVSIVLAEIQGVLSASTSVDTPASSTTLTTGYVRIPHTTESQTEYGQPAMQLVATLEPSTIVSVFCNLK